MCRALAAGMQQDPRQQMGRDGEALARAALRRGGYEILEERYRTPFGEIDVIARDGDTLVFVEVKARRDDHFGGGAAAVTVRKQRTITRVAQAYLARTRLHHLASRFDVVVIEWPVDAPPRAQIIRSAFDAVT